MNIYGRSVYAWEFKLTKGDLISDPEAFVSDKRFPFLEPKRSVKQD